MRERRAIPVVRRSQAYLVLVGVVVGLLTAGLAVPLIFGESIGGGDEVRAGQDFELPGDDSGSGPPSAAAASDTPAPTTVAGAGAVTPAHPPTQSEFSTKNGGSSPTVLEDGGAGAPTGADRGPAAALTATDRGVTAKTIKVGALLLDVATVGRLGVAVAIDPAQQQAAVQAFVDDLNARGGIHGRKIEMYYRAFDVTDRNDQIAACRELTQEKQVFAVLAGFNTVDPTLCIVEENKTPLLASSNNHPDWVFGRAGGRLLSLYPRSGRMMAALVAEMERVQVANKRIGILSDGLNDPGGQVAAQLQRLLEQRGHKVVYRGQLSDDISTAASQVPVEVNRMQTAGGGGAEVVVFLASNAVYGTQFVNQASSQRYHPIYVSSDWASNNGDSNNQNMPESYGGAIAFTFNRGLSAKRSLPPTALANRCRDIYNARSGRTLKPPNNPEFGLTMTYCDDVRLLEALAGAVGPELTRDKLTGARAVVGPFETASMSPGAFGADKFDLADLVRTERWTYECKCWSAVDAFHRPGG